jgi:hypothetical protein
MKGENMVDRYQSVYYSGMSKHDFGDYVLYEDYQIVIDERDTLRAENAELKDFRGGTIHESWLTESRENLIEALRFQGATTKVLLKEHDELRAENAALRIKTQKRTIKAH